MHILIDRDSCRSEFSLSFLAIGSRVLINIKDIYIQTLEHVFTYSKGSVLYIDLEFSKPFKATTGDLVQTIDLALEESCWSTTIDDLNLWVESQSHKHECLCAIVLQ